MPSLEGARDRRIFCHYARSRRLKRLFMAQRPTCGPLACCCARTWLGNICPHFFRLEEAAGSRSQTSQRGPRGPRGGVAPFATRSPAPAVELPSRTERGSPQEGHVRPVPPPPAHGRRRECGPSQPMRCGDATDHGRQVMALFPDAARLAQELLLDDLDIRGSALKAPTYDPHNLLRDAGSRILCPLQRSPGRWNTPKCTRRRCSTGRSC